MVRTMVIPIRTGPTCTQRNFSQRDSSPKISPAASRIRKKRIVMRNYDGDDKKCVGEQEKVEKE